MTNKKNEVKEQLLKTYARLTKELGNYPTRVDLKKIGISRDKIRHHFGDLDNIKGASREAFPEYFKGVIDPDFYDDEAFRALKEKVKKFKRFVVTTAVAGAPVHEDFYDSLKVYCEKNKALLLILPADYALYDLPVDLVSKECIVFKDIKLNDNIMISSIKIDPKQIDPSVSLDDIGCHAGTVIIGSPKQRRRPIANSASKQAHIIQSTGALTKPRYVPRNGAPKRRDILAAQQHVMGCVVVEIVDAKTFHFRNIEMCKDGSFNDLFLNYSSDGVTFAPVEAIVQGDLHIGDTDPKVDAAADDLCRKGKPKYRIFHDIFDGKSINPHEKDNKILQAQYAICSKLDLEAELVKLAEVLKGKLDLNTAGQLLIVPSNHDDFLLRYLKAGKFDDNYNRLISVKLQALAIEGKNPISAGLEELLGYSFGERIRWIDIDEDVKLTRQRIEVGAHGHLGANGNLSPGSAGMFKAYGKVSYGHCHFGEINHGAMSVGTSTRLKVEYNRGPSSWSHTHQVIYEDGTRQLINIINGEYTSKN